MVGVWPKKRFRKKKSSWVLEEDEKRNFAIKVRRNRLHTNAKKRSKTK